MESYKKRLLCVDDDDDSCKLVRAVLDDLEIVPAHTLAEGLLRATTEKFDLFLIDYHLPDGTGFELATMLCGLHAETPIVFFSGEDWISPPLAAANGACGFVQKGSVTFNDDLRYRVDQLVGYSH